jgi:hypothetical protein
MMYLILIYLPLEAMGGGVFSMIGSNVSFSFEVGIFNVLLS